MTKNKADTGEIIAMMATVAAMICDAVRAKGIEVERPEEYRQDGELHHLWLDVPIGDQTCTVLIMRPGYFAGRIRK
jgi:hypothetical protein